MKTLFLSWIFTLVSCVLLAQPDKYSKALMNAPYITFEERTISFKEGVHPAAVILISAAESDYIKDLKNWLKTKYAIEAKKNSGYYSAIGVVIAEWSTDTLNFYYITDKEGDAVRLSLLAEKKGVYCSQKEHADVIGKIKSAVSGQVKEFYIKYYDEKIADQQKFYDTQVNDFAKLTKKKDKMNSEVENHNNAMQKAEDQMREVNSNINASDGNIKSLNAQLQQDQKMADQALKEAETQQQVILAREADYNKLNASGSLNTKEGEKVMKDLEKQRGKLEKLQSALTKANEKTTKSENAILKEEQNKTKLLSKLQDLKSSKDKHSGELSDLKRDLESNESDLKDEQKEIDAAKLDMDALKAAKEKLIGAQ